MAEIAGLKNVDIKIDGHPLESYIDVIIEKFTMVTQHLEQIYRQLDALEADRAARSDDGR